jgi:hypothetical protein
VEPLGSYERVLSPAVSLTIGAVAVVSAAALMELSRTLAETYKGRWFAGNGRDVFHVAVAGVLASAFLANGLPAALAWLGAATVAIAPLLLVDELPAQRPARVLLLLALFALGSAPPLLEPVSIVETCNTMARALFKT